MIIIKIGGGKTINLRGIINDLSDIKKKIIIVHGANALRDELAQKLNLCKKVVTSVSGYSSVFSDKNTIDLQMMAYAGLRNKRIVELCQQAGINAIGLSGLDGRVVSGKRNKGIKVKEGKKKFLLRDFSGKPKEVNRILLNLLLENNFTPVLSVPIIDETGYAINSENDDIVSLLQREFFVKVIVQLIEAPGLLKDIQNPLSLVKFLSIEDLKRWEDRADGRIRRKLLAMRKLIELNSATVFVSDGRTQNPVKDALAGKGTIIRSSK